MSNHENGISSEEGTFSFYTLLIVVVLSLFCLLPTIIVPKLLYGGMFYVIGEALFPLGRLASLSFGIWSISVFCLIANRTLTSLIATSLFMLIPFLLVYLLISISVSMNDDTLIELYETEVIWLDDVGKNMLREDLAKVKKLNSEGIHIGIPFVASNYIWNIDIRRRNDFDPKALTPSAEH